MFKLKKITNCILFLLFTIGCDTPPTENKYGGNLIYGSPVAPTIINPLLTTDSISAHLVPLIFNGLFKIDKEGNIIPDLAEFYEIKQGGLEYRIKLKKNIKFQDGIELTAKDVKFTYDKIRNTEKSNYFDAFSKIDKIEVIDKYNLKLYLKETFAPLLYALSIGILPKHIYLEKNKEDFLNWHPIGSGPFKLTSLNNNKIILSRHDYYFSKKPYLDKIICDIAPAQTLWAKLIRGDIDYAKGIPENLMPEVKNNFSLCQYELLDPRCYILFMNFKNPIFKDTRVRQALNYGIDKELIINEVLLGRGIPNCGPVFPHNWAYNKNLSPYIYDPQKCLDLLGQAGWIRNEKDGFLYKGEKCFEFTCVTLKGFPNVEDSVLHIQRQLNQIGIKMNIKILHNVEDFYSLMKNGNWDALFGGLGCEPEPDYNYKYFHSVNIGGTNIFNYKNIEIDRLLEMGRKTNNINERKKFYYEFQEKFYNDPPGVFIFYKNISIAINKNVINASPDIETTFRDIEHWRIAKNGNN